MKLWIARDPRGWLILFVEKPYLTKDGFYNGDCDSAAIGGKEDFPEVTFENSPQEVELKLVKEE